MIFDVDHRKLTFPPQGAEFSNGLAASGSRSQISDAVEMYEHGWMNRAKIVALGVVVPGVVSGWFWRFCGHAFKLVESVPEPATE
jgi:hypothetical protein